MFRTRANSLPPYRAYAITFLAIGITMILASTWIFLSHYQSLPRSSSASQGPPSKELFRQWVTALREEDESTRALDRAAREHEDNEQSRRRYADQFEMARSQLNEWGMRASLADGDLADDFAKVPKAKEIFDQAKFSANYSVQASDASGKRYRQAAADQQRSQERLLEAEQAYAASLVSENPRVQEAEKVAAVGEAHREIEKAYVGVALSASQKNTRLAAAAQAFDEALNVLVEREARYIDTLRKRDSVSDYRRLEAEYEASLQRLDTSPLGPNNVRAYEELRRKGRLLADAREVYNPTVANNVLANYDRAKTDYKIALIQVVKSNYR